MIAPVPGRPYAEPMDPADGLLDHPYDVYRRLRDTAPVHRIAGPDGTPAWLVTRYDDVARPSPTRGSRSTRGMPRPGTYKGFSLPPALDANLLNMDPPDHTRIRRLVGRAFTPAASSSSARPSVAPPTDSSTRSARTAPPT